jgi:hypothetical protein
MSVNTIPTAKDYPTRFNKREAKVLESALQASGTLKNKTIDSTNTISAGVAVASPVLTTPTVNGSVVNVATGSMTAAQVIGATTAFDLVAAPGAGKINIVKRIEFFLDYAAAFTSGDDFSVQYETTAAAVATIDKASLLGTADLAFMAAPTGYDTSASVAGFSMTANANKKLQFKVATSAFADGTGSVVKWRIHYETVTLLT